MLIQAFKGTAADEPAPIATSGTGDPKAVPKGSVYRVDGDVKTLNPHVGHKVDRARQDGLGHLRTLARCHGGASTVWPPKAGVVA